MTNKIEKQIKKIMIGINTITALHHSNVQVIQEFENLRKYIIDKHKITDDEFKILFKDVVAKM